MEKNIGVIDEPVAPGASDNLDINTHSRALIRFIQDTKTPITVGIQGEWGSGKTSLINSIHHAFDGDEKKVKQIWINSWEYSLLSTPEEALLKIVSRIIDELIDADKNAELKEKFNKVTKTIFQGAIRVGAQVTLGNEAANVANELLNSSSQSISALRKQLDEVVDALAQRSSNPYEKVIIYVDDLDRIEPKNAVAILELLKNIFSVPKCVFILAIDYQVVVKGLEHKFGKQTPENEWEFRAFFDKIIQLPFMMPMGQYNIGKYVNSLLVDIGFVEGKGLDDEAVREIILRTIGGNPRSIKRLVNSVSLIQIFVEKRKTKGKDAETDDDEENMAISADEEKFLLFALLCLQIAYPPIYSLLTEEPNFPKWDDKFAFKQTNRSEERTGDNDRLSHEEMKKIFDDEFEIATQSEDFNEEWEKALYRVCYGRPRLKPRASDISKFFSHIKDELIGEDRQGIIGDTVAQLMTQTSVTSVTSTDQGQTGEMTARSKLLNTVQQGILTTYSPRLFAALKSSGSVTFGAHNRTSNITGWTRLKRKGLFKSKKLDECIWWIGFPGIVGFGCGVSGKPDQNLDLVKYFDTKREGLEAELPGIWVIDYKEGRVAKNISLAGPLYDKKDFASAAHLAACDDAKREATIKWATENVSKFERLVIEICNEFFEHKKALKKEGLSM